MKSRKISVSLGLLATLALSANPSFSQTAAFKSATPIAASASTAVPSLIPYSGTAIAADGKLFSGETGVTFQIFKQESGGEALWTESQMVSIDRTGHYQVQLGASNPNGLPADLFSTGEARWFEIQIAGEAPQPRILLASVPYALKASDAETLGGLPASAFVLAGSKAAANLAAAAAPNVLPDVTSSTVTTPGGTAGYIPVFTGATTIADSILFQNASGLGIGDVPDATLDVNGRSVFRGALQMSRTGNATVSAGTDSNPLSFLAQSYDSTTKTSANPSFSLQSEAIGNDTASPGATLNLLYTSSLSPIAETGLYFNPNGTIHFATGQTFPGTGTGNGTITGVTAGTDLTGGGTSGNVTLNLNTASTDARYAQLAAANIFTGNQTFNGNVTFPDFTYLTGGFQARTASLIETTSTGLTVDTTQSGSIYALLDVPTADSQYGWAIEGVAENAYSGIYGYGDDKSEAGVIASGNIGVYAFSDESGYVDEGGKYQAKTLTAAVYAQAGVISSQGNVEANVPAAVFADGGAETSAYPFSQIAVSGTTDDNYAAQFVNNSDSDDTLFIRNSSTGPLFEAFSTSGHCQIDQQADLTCTGTISGSNLTATAHTIKTYGVQSAENWYEDAGSGQLQNGVAHIDLDAAFGETVNTAVDYHVFLTPNGDSNSLYVSNKTASGFEVHESGHGTSSIAFDYRIMAKRKGYEQVRLEDITEKVKRQNDERQKFHPTSAAAKNVKLPTVPPKPVAVPRSSTAQLNPLGQHEVR
jgi:hypothetical protein